MDSDLAQDLEDICYYFESSFFKLYVMITHTPVFLVLFIFCVCEPSLLSYTSQ